jgi:hypothetical protein
MIIILRLLILLRRWVLELLRIMLLLMLKQLFRTTICRAVVILLIGICSPP